MVVMSLLSDMMDDVKLIDDLKIRQVIGREKQIKAINSNILVSARTGKGRKIIVSGEAGTGKTSLIKYICQNSGLPVIYINCSVNYTAFQIASNIKHTIFQTKEVIQFGSNTRKIIRDIKLKAEIERKHYIIILDNAEHINNSVDLQVLERVLSCHHIFLYVYDTDKSDIKNGIKFPKYSADEKKRIISCLLKQNNIHLDIQKINWNENLKKVVDDINLNLVYNSL